MPESQILIHLIFKLTCLSRNALIEHFGVKFGSRLPNFGFGLAAFGSLGQSIALVHRYDGVHYHLKWERKVGGNRLEECVTGDRLSLFGGCMPVWDGLS